jgi:hypothetical protein
MARPLRIQYPGAIYHVMNRGDRREEIFLDDQDRLCFLETLVALTLVSLFQTMARSIRTSDRRDEQL